MQLKLFETEIRKTGYVLENEIAIVLRGSGWTVISNKYYVDDSEDSVREMDLIAYKAARVQHFDVYTTLIISCKKSEDNAWALLARELNEKDPNSDWWPLHAWTNDKALQYQFGLAGAARRYHDAASAYGVKDAMSLPPVEVFAFQEMDKTSGKPKNDKPIYSSVTSLMKAQAYEMAALPTRKRSPAVYQFNLLSVIDTTLLRLMFDKTKIKCTERDTEHYLARYIIRKREIFARIRFIGLRAFASILEDYGRLHKFNCEWLASECDAFYEGLVKDWKRTGVLIESFKNKIHWFLSWRIEWQLKKDVSVGAPTLYWNEEASELSVGFGLPEDILFFLNTDAESRQRIAAALKDIYRYEGPFSVTHDVPF
ncbi:MAG TPA: hypothetical protein PKY50_01370 [Candidatus Competibacter sp.]|nr:hypothetical protein [Candidatus Competibacter sp.]